jgi:hypothetical protein
VKILSTDQIGQLEIFSLTAANGFSGARNAKIDDDRDDAAFIAPSRASLPLVSRANDKPVRSTSQKSKILVAKA